MISNVGTAQVSISGEADKQNVESGVCCCLFQQMEYYSTLRRKEILTLVTVNLEDILLSEISQS